MGDVIKLTIPYLEKIEAFKAKMAEVNEQEEAKARPSPLERVLRLSKGRETAKRQTLDASAKLRSEIRNQFAKLAIHDGRDKAIKWLEDEVLHPYKFGVCGNE
jgi:hypothetical protein